MNRDKDSSIHLTWDFRLGFVSTAGKMFERSESNIPDEDKPKGYVN